MVLRNNAGRIADLCPVQQESLKPLELDEFRQSPVGDVRRSHVQFFEFGPAAKGPQVVIRNPAALKP